MRNAAGRYAQLLQKCGNSRSLWEGKRLHEEIVKEGLDKVTFLANHLVLMYGKCGSMEDAYRTFKSLEETNIYSWTIMVGAFVENGHSREALQLLCTMDHEGLKLDKVMFISLTSACSNLGLLSQARGLHFRVATAGWASDKFVGNSLLNMYCKSGSVEDAMRIFVELEERDVVSWTTIIAGYAQKGHIGTCFKLFRQMLIEGVQPNEATFLSLLGVCAWVGALEPAVYIHELIKTSSFIKYANVCTALIDVYGKCGKPGLALDTFRYLEMRDVVAWNAVIAVCAAQDGWEKDSLHLFRHMLLVGEFVDDVSLIAALDACSNLRHLEAGQQVHMLALESNMLDVVNVSNSLVNMYGKCGNVFDARLFFEETQAKNAVTWSAIIAAYSQNGFGKDALDLYMKMEQEGIKADEYTFTTLLDACTSTGDVTKGKSIHRCMEDIGMDTHSGVGTVLVNMYGKCGYLAEASLAFSRLEQRSLLAWTALIGSYAEREGREAVELFREMQLDGFQPDDIVFMSVLHGCSHAGLLEDGWTCFKIMTVDYGVPPTGDHYGCILDLLGRSGRLGEAEELLSNMPFEAEVIGMKALLSACKVHGDMVRAERAAEVIPQFSPEEAAPYLLVSNMYAERDER